LEHKINELTDSEKEIEVTLKYDEIKKDVEQEVLKQTKNIQMPGFRKGKVPLNMIKKMYGNALEYEASEKVANSKFWQVAKEKELNPIGQPQLIDIKFNPGEDLFFKVKYEVLPELEVNNYKDIEIELPDFNVKDEEIEHEISHIRKANSTNEDAEVIGDDRNFMLNIEFVRVDEAGNPLAESKPETLDVDLSNEKVSPEIIENSRGKKAGDSFSFTFKDPSKKSESAEETKAEDYHYIAKINSIKKITLPELNEELIKKVTKNKFSTEAELREGIKKDIQNFYDQKVEELLKDRLLHRIIESNDFIPPQTMIKNVLDGLVKQEEESVKKSGYQKFNREEAEKKLEKSAELEVKWFLIKREIEKKENISVTDEDLKELAKTEAEKTGLPEDKLINYYKTSNIGDRLIDKKLFDFLKEHSKIKKVNPEKLLNKETEETK
jgi:trigger factor